MMYLLFSADIKFDMHASVATQIMMDKTAFSFYYNA